MFSRYFGDRYFAPRYWPNTGEDIVLVVSEIQLTGSRQHTVSVTGSRQRSIAITGSRQRTIDITGSVED